MILRRTTDLAKVLPEWLGWSITSMGESPLTVAIVSKKLKSAKYLLEKSPRLMASSLHERIKFLGVNALMIAVQLGCDSDLIDFLLAKSISPALTDQHRGWNIFHYMCDRNHHELLKHLLKKLPCDVVEALLAQQSKGRLNTPLHLAAKRGFKTAVKLVVEFSKTSALVRDVEGSIPLHCAVRSGFPETIQILVDAAPSGLHMENGVGETPLEIAILQDLIERNKQLQYQNNNRSSSNFELETVNDQPPRLDIDKLEIELPKFRVTLEELVSSGTLKNGTKPVTDMFAFAEHMERKLVAAKAARNVDSTPNSNIKEAANRPKALANVRAMIGVVDGHRDLVHLVDVQISVQSILSKLSQKSETTDYSHRRRRITRSRAHGKEGLDPEEDSEQKEFCGSYIYRQGLRTGPDTF